MDKSNVASVDWLTLTSRDPRRGADWLETQRIVADMHAQEGWRLENCRLLGYEGRMLGKMFVGVREDGWMARLSGDWAQSYGSPFCPDAVKCTRIDLAVTVWDEGKPSDRVEDMWNALCSFGDTSTRPLRAKAWTGPRQMQGFSIGSRSSLRYARVYDKHSESHDDSFRGAVRFEVEFKAEAAQAVVEKLYSANDFQGCIRDFVGQHLRSRGVAVEFPSQGFYTLPAVPHVGAPLDRQLRYINVQVRPLFLRLVELAGLERALGALFGDELTPDAKWDILSAIESVLEG